MQISMFDCVAKADELNPREAGSGNCDEQQLWIAYCAFHLADYASALQVRLVT